MKKNHRKPGILTACAALQLTFETAAFGLLNILHGGRLVKAVNESPRRVCVAAINETINGDDEWFPVAPQGEHINDVGLQIVDEESGRAMVAAFNSLLGKTARGFRGLPIYVGHPTDPGWRKKNPEIYAKYPHPVGRITGMKFENGLAWFKPAFNEVGLPLVSGPAATFEAFSPGWGMVPLHGRGERVFRPVLLDHIGLTNFPQIAGTKIGLNEEVEQHQQQTEGKTMPPWLLALLGLAADATEEQGRTALQTALNERTTARADVDRLTTQVQTLTTQLTTANNERTTAETARKTERTARAAVVVTMAINEGRIVEADRQTWLDSLVAAQDFENEVKKLGSLKGAINTRSQVGELGQRKGENQYAPITAINEAVSKYAKEHGHDLNTPDGYHAAYIGTKAAQPALFENAKN